MPRSQRSRSSLRTMYSFTSGCGRIRKRSSSIASITVCATASVLITPSTEAAVAPAMRSMLVSTACGQSTETLMPRSPYWMERCSASATAAFLVTPYGAEPIEASRPAALAVLSR